MIVHLLDIEWLLSTLFDASLFNLRAAGNGGSFFVPFPDSDPESGLLRQKITSLGRAGRQRR